jgi:hypothetical protein
MTCDELTEIVESHGMTVYEPFTSYDNCLYLRWYSPYLSTSGLENVWGTAYYDVNTHKIYKIMKWGKIQKLNGCKELSFSGNATGSLNQVTPNRLNKLCNQIKKNVKEFLIQQKLDKIQNDFN